MGILDRFKPKESKKEDSPLRTPSSYSPEEVELFKEASQLKKHAKFTMDYIIQQAKNQPDHEFYQDVKNPKEFEFRSQALDASMVGEYERSVDLCNKGLKINPVSPYLFYMKGRSECDIGNFKDGVKNLQQAIRLKPNFVDAYSELGYLQQKLGNIEEAKKYYAIAQKIDPSFKMPPMTIQEERESTAKKIFELLGEQEPNWHPMLPEKTKTLSEKGIKVVTDFLSDHNDICLVHGSFSIMPRILPELRRIPKDIDVEIDVGEDEAIQFASNLLTRLKDVGENVRINPIKNWIIESLIDGKWERAVDISYKGEPFEDLLSIGSENESPENVRKLREKRTQEQQLQDLFDLYRMLKTTIELAKLNPSKKPLAERCEFLFQRWQKLYGDIDFSKLEVN